MYTKYWNLSRSPFLNAMDPQLIYMTPHFREGLARLYYLVDQERVAGVLTGTYGVGKSLSVEYLFRLARQSKMPVIRVDAIPNGSLPVARHILRTLGLPTEGIASLADALMRLQEYSESDAHLERALLLIDEAQNLAIGDGFYFVHYLTNLRITATGSRPEQPLFTIILAGTPALDQALQKEESLRHRIQFAWQLGPLSEEETTEYVQHHLKAVGGDIWIFSREALSAIYKYSQGIPRSINNLCDTALMLGFSASAPSVDAGLVARAAHDTGLDAAAEASAPQGPEAAK